MKKALSFVAIASLAVAVVACGPSKAELEAKEKATQDSLAEVAKADSIAAAAKAEAEAAAAKAQADSLAAVAKADSIAKAEEAAKGKKGGKK
jgi:regulator of protease activity HflC (stomatin/prohibitin superfamily)